MSAGTWSDVLLQWVNCLKLSEPITTLESLQNGRFISSLLQILVMSSIKLEDNVLRHVLDLIHIHYPKYDLNTNDIDTLFTISNEHLMSICSLLMHYSCMVQQNEILIKPLCRISNDVQLSIRTFLQKTNTNVTVEDLQNIISESIKCNEHSAERLNRQFDVEPASLACDSPLQDFLKTPSSGKIRAEKDRQLKKLRSELEFERFEKADLLEENMEHQKKIMSLGKDLKDKCKQISKLRSELYAFENVTPPNATIEMNEVEGHLRSQIDNLERYITQCQSEQDILEADRDKLSEKLKKSQEEVIVWQKKAVTWETNLEDLSEKYLRGNAEKAVLNKECIELRTLLDEMRNTQHNTDSFLEDSPHRNKRRSVIQCATEDLAHSIVEVQLKDAQKENDELHEQLKASEETTQSLRHKLQSTEIDLNNARIVIETKDAELGDFKNTIRELNGSIEELKLKIIDIVREKDDLLRNIENLDLVKLKLETEFNQLRCSNENELRKFENTVAAQCIEFNLQKDDMRKKIVILENTIELAKMECSKNQENFDKAVVENKELREKLLDYEDNMSKMIIEESSLKSQVSSERDNYVKLISEFKRSEENNKKTVVEYESAISKLKCDNDDLRSDTRKLDMELQNARESCNRMEAEKNNNKVQFQRTLELNKDDIYCLQQKLETNTKQLEEKEEEMLNVICQLNEMKLIEEALRKDIQSVKDESKRSEDAHQTHLMKINEDNLSAITEISNKFNELKTIYEETCAETIRLKTDNGNRMQEMQREKILLVDEISKNNSSITHLKQVIAVLEESLRSSRSDLELYKSERNALEYRLESQTKVIKETENNILRVHENAITAKNDMLKQIEEAKIETTKEKNSRKELEELIRKENETRDFLKTGLSGLLNEQTKHKRLYDVLRKCIIKINESIESKPIENCSMHAEENDLNVITVEIEDAIDKIYEKNRVLSGLVASLELDKTLVENKLKYLEEENVRLKVENEKILSDFTLIHEEKNKLIADQMQLRRNYEINAKANEELEMIRMKNGDLRNALAELKDKNGETFNDYQTFVEQSKTYRNLIDELLRERNSLEITVSELGQRVHDIQMKYFHITQSIHKRQFEQKDVIEIVTRDVQRQFSRYSKIICNLNSSYTQIYELVVQAILSNKKINYVTLLNDLCIQDISAKVEELRDRASDASEQIKSFENSVERFQMKPSKVLQENVSKLNAFNPDSKKQDDEWKKKYITLKQKLTLTENIKNNYEKKVKQLREENKKLSLSPKNLENVQIMQSTFENVHCDKESKLDKELSTLRATYGNLMIDNTKLELDNGTLRKRLDDLNVQLSGLSLIKEAYEKLLEDNNKLMTEVDTLKYKRTRDKENFARVLKKEIEEKSGYETKRIQEVRSEYEGKLEKMKDKMIKLYKDEVEKEMEKVCAEKSDNAVLLHTVQQYKSELDEAKEIIKTLKMKNFEKDKFNTFTSADSQSVTSENASRGNVVKQNVPLRERLDERDVMKQSRLRLLGKGQDTLGRKSHIDDRRHSTMPRNVGMDVIKEVRIRKTSVPSDMGQNLEMEDEGELFNNKYLTDLQEGRCTVTSGRESNASRLSELAWRNSMCPPHLKSSYPAETQFTSPTQFQEDDIKIGNVACDDSRLLHGERPRKKDAGTTSYKKPGPPTPSKNGGRLSLQGNEIHTRDGVKQHNESSKTPNRLKALFMGRNAGVRDSESQSGTPRASRLSYLFRKNR